MTTLPIYWGESDGVGAVLADQAPPGWVRPHLERRYTLEPLDTLDADTLKGLRRLMLAQPRVLTAQENVALDDWVRGGGRLLLFADPMLTHHSRFPLGDRRRPQDVILLSPILTHWGLELRFDPEQPRAGEAHDRSVALAGGAAPVAMAGTLHAAAQSGCAVRDARLLAQCRIGKGAVVVVADAALLDEPEDAATGPRADALDRLTALAFD